MSRIFQTHPFALAVSAIYGKHQAMAMAVLQHPKLRLDVSESELRRNWPDHLDPKRPSFFNSSVTTKTKLCLVLPCLSRTRTLRRPSSDAHPRPLKRQTGGCRLFEWRKL